MRHDPNSSSTLKASLKQMAHIFKSPDILGLLGKGNSSKGAESLRQTVAAASQQRRSQ